MNTPLHTSRAIAAACLLLLAATQSPTARAQSASCAANEAPQTLSFATYPWTTGSTTYSATPGTGASQLTVNGSVTGGYLASGSPSTGQSGGYASSFVYTVDRTLPSQSDTVTFNFSKPINNLQLTVTDIDHWGTRFNAYNDQTTVTGSGPGGSVTPTATAASTLVEILNGNTARASSISGNAQNCALSSSQCNATFNFSAPVTSVTITYGNTTSPAWAWGNPPAQAVGVYFNGFCVQNPDLTLSKSAPGTAKLLEPFDFVLRASNPGSAGSSGTVTVTDTLAANRLNINGITAAAGWTCTPASGFPITGGSVTVSCTSTASIAAGASSVPVATINVTPQPSALPGPVGNTASISGGNEVDTGNNSASTSTTLTRRQADLSITKASSGAFNVGASVSYTLTVTNSGPDSVTGAIVTDTPVSGLNCAANAPVSCSGGGCPSSPSPLLFSHLTAGLPLGNLSGTSGSNTVTLTFACTVL